MIPDDLREWIELLRREGELVEVTAEVDPYLEISEIADRTEARRAAPRCSSATCAARRTRC